MRNNSEFQCGESFPAPEDDSEPLPLTPELIEEFLEYINDLWRQHGNAREKREEDTQQELEIALHFAYHQLNALKGNVDHLILPNKLEVDLAFELEFSCNHLHKVIKYLG